MYLIFSARNKTTKGYEFQEHYVETTAYATLFVS